MLMENSGFSCNKNILPTAIIYSVITIQIVCTVHSAIHCNLRPHIQGNSVTDCSWWFKHKSQVKWLDSRWRGRSQNPQWLLEGFLTVGTLWHFMTHDDHTFTYSWIRIVKLHGHLASIWKRKPKHYINQQVRHMVYYIISFYYTNKKFM